MAWLAREAYRSEPAALLDLDRLPSRAEVSARLLDEFVPRRYAVAAEVTRHRNSAGRVRRWLTCLAYHMDERKERELTWWQLHGPLSTPWPEFTYLAAVVGCASIALCVAGAVVNGQDGLVNGVGYLLVAGLLVGPMMTREARAQWPPGPG
jgi:hypothetical protein